MPVKQKQDIAGDDSEMNDAFWYIAASVTGRRGFPDFHDMMKNEKAQDFINHIVRRGARTKEHLSSRYGTDPCDAARKIEQEAADAGCSVIHYGADNYPSLLREIYDPPAVLFARGNLSLLATPRMLSIVGTRHADDYARMVARRIAGDSATNSICVVSGLAHGIDQWAHEGALDAGGSTVAVLGHGHSVRYGPSGTWRRMEESESTLFLSEYPPPMKPQKWTFVQRNRIISGLSPATAIIMAAEKSGALITAQFAMDQNREVFACPGNAFDERYAGCNRLIQDGAHLLTTTDDILQMVYAGKREFMPKKVVTPFTADSIEGKVMALCATAPADFDLLMEESRLDSPTLSGLLSRLELEGYLMRRGNRWFAA